MDENGPIEYGHHRIGQINEGQHMIEEGRRNVGSRCRRKSSSKQSNVHVASRSTPSRRSRYHHPLEINPRVVLDIVSPRNMLGQDDAEAKNGLVSSLVMREAIKFATAHC